MAHITHLIYFFTGTAAGTLKGHEPTAAYQGSIWGLLVLQTPTRAQAGVCWSYGQGGRGGRGVGGSLTNVLKLKLSNINLNA